MHCDNTSPNMKHLIKAAANNYFLFSNRQSTTPRYFIYYLMTKGPEQIATGWHHFLLTYSTYPSYFSASFK